MLLNLPKKILARVGRRMLNPAEVLTNLGVQPGWHVLELGRPVGFFARDLHYMVGEEGQIIIAAPNAEALEQLHDETEHAHTKAITLADVLGGNAAPKHSLDLIILTNLLSSVAHADNFCLSVNEYLKPSGRVAIIDWDKNPPSESMSAVTLSREAAINLVQKCGFKFERMLDAAGYHYGLIFRATDA